MWAGLFKQLWEVLGGLPGTIALALAVLAAYWWMEFRAFRREVRQAQAQADEQAKEDRKRNEREHDRLFTAVSALQGVVASLQADVRVLLDRSDRSGD